jgi:hexosaminidase
MTGVPKRTIPALREWVAAPGRYTFAASSRIVVDAAGVDVLTGTADTFAGDLAAATGHRPDVVSDTAASSGTATSSDIVLRVDADLEDVGAQGYQLTIGTQAVITAPAPVGVFYGTRSLLQLLTHGAAVPGGTARDWPRYPERGIHIDSAHRRYSQTQWHNLVRDLAYLKLNQLTVDLYPKGFTADQAADLTAFAARYHVTVIPMMSVPSYTGETILRERPEYGLHPGGPAPASHAMDFTRPGALEVIRTWVERDLPRWPGPYWHGGADEFLAYPGQPINWRAYPQFEQFARARTGNDRATGRDAYVWLLNWLAELLRSHGKTLRVRGDHLESGGVLVLDPSITVEHCVGTAAPTVLTPQQLADAGHRIVNADENLLHYDSARHVDARMLYDRFDVATFSGGRSVTGPAAGRVAGAQLRTWMAPREPGTYAESNQELWANLYAPLRVLAQATWDTPRPAGGYERLRTLTRHLDHGPGGTHIGGEVTGNPAAAIDGNGHLAYFSVDGGGMLRCATVGKSLALLAEQVAGSPAAVANRDGTLAYLARTTGGELLCGWQSRPGSPLWRQETLLAGHVATDPVSTVDRDGRVHYLLRTTGGELIHGRQGPGSWRQERVPVPAGGNPAVCTDPDGGLHLFLTDHSGQLCHAWRSGPDRQWQRETAGVAVVGVPAAVFDQHGRLLVFVRTGSDQLSLASRTSDGWTRQTLADDIAGDPVAICDRVGRTVYFVRTGDDGLRHGWQVAPGGAAWNSAVLLEMVAGTPAIAHDVNSRLTYFVTTAYGHLQHGWQRTPGTGPWLRTTLIGPLEL